MDLQNTHERAELNTRWLTLHRERRIDILNQASAATGLPPSAIEKDWWVSLCIQACFSLPYREQLVFKGGTSLSKGWNAIERFSEDIDLAINRAHFGFVGDISNTQIGKLRRASCAFISSTFLNDLVQTLTDWNAIHECQLFAHPITLPDKDPQCIEIQFDSVVDATEYLPKRVLIEVGVRSLMEPVELREINSILSVQFPQLDLAIEAFPIPIVLPRRTFLEKIFLLHEEFAQAPEKIRIDRLSRHLYDLERLMDSEHGEAALQDTELYNNIVAHREKFNAIKGVDYSHHTPEKIKIIPPDSVIGDYEKDYSEMTQFMIYGDALTFAQLIQRISDLQGRINAIRPV